MRKDLEVRVQLLRLDGKTVAGLVHFSDLQADISRLLPASVVADTEFY